jgi:dipeptidyl aminopeptidase/acylaminoacyl peptidase
VWLQPLDGTARRLDLGDLVVSGAYGYEIAVGRTGAIAFVATTPSRPAELYIMDSPAAKPRRLTDFNAWATQVAFGRMERVTWKGPDNFEEDGVLVYPPNFSPSSSHPRRTNVGVESQFCRASAADGARGMARLHA